MNDPAPGFVRTLSSGSPIVDSGTLSAVWTVSINGQEVSRTTKPIITNSGREAVMKTLLSEPQWGGFITRSIVEEVLPPNPLFMELFE